MLVNNCEINVTNGTLPEEEIACYVSRGREKYGKRLQGMDINVDGEYVELSYRLEPIPFQRIRRITGYLVGTMERWNDSKVSEEADRVKHSAD